MGCRWLVLASWLMVSCAQSRRPIVLAPSDEPCNGIDDDGDGAIDEGCACTPFDTIVPVAPGPSALVWTGTGYIFDDVNAHNELVLHGIDATGHDAWSATASSLGDAAQLRGAWMAWDGQELAMVGVDPPSRRIGLYFFDPQDRSFRESPQGLVSPLGMSADGPCIAFAGDRFGVAWIGWEDVNVTALYFEELAPSGAPVSPEITLPLAHDTELTSLTRAGAGYVLVMQSLPDDTVSLVFIDPTGATPPRTVPVDVGTGWYPNLAKLRDGFAVSFGVPTNDDPLAVELLDASGAERERVVHGTGPLTAAIAAMGEDYIAFTVPFGDLTPDVSEITIPPTSAALTEQPIATLLEGVTAVISSTAAAARQAVAIPHQVPPADPPSTSPTNVREIIQRCGDPGAQTP